MEIARPIQKPYVVKDLLQEATPLFESVTKKEHTFIY